MKINNLLDNKRNDPKKYELNINLNKVIETQ